MSTKIFTLNLLLLILLYIHFFAAKSLNLTLKLVHRDSPESPVYPGKLSTREKIQRYIKSSDARAAFLKSLSTARYNSSTRRPTVVNPEVGHYLFTYMVKIGIGDPVHDYWLYLDTGSGLSWIQCLPCKNCYKQNDPIFDPTKSKTYERVLCSYTTPCDYGRECIQASCIYHVIYEDDDNTSGTLSQENFILTSSTNEKFTFRTIFGCSDDTKGTFDAPMAGLLGMDLDPESFMSQLAKDTIHRFAYCLVDHGAHPSGHSYLRFDSNMYGGRTDLKKTPLIRHPVSFGYYVILEDISINNIRVGYPNGTFLFRPDGSGGCMVDTGTPMTLIDGHAYLELAAAYTVHFEQLGIRSIECPANYGLRDTSILCFSLPKDFNDFPSLTYHFAQGADLYIDPKYAFTVAGDPDMEDKFFFPNVRSAGRFTLIGSLQMVNTRFSVDNEIHQLAFAPEQCDQDKGLF